MERIVYTVDEVKIENNPPRVYVNVEGATRTSGWTNSKLVRHQNNEDLSKSGIYEFDFVADPPNDIFTEVISPITASFEFNSILLASKSDNSKVVIYSETNNIEKELPDFALDLP